MKNFNQQTQKITLSRRFILMDLSKWLVLTIGIIALYLLTRVESPFFSTEHSLFKEIAFEEIIFILGVGGFLLSKLIYLALYRKRCRILATRNGIKITRGILWSNELFIPFSKISHMNIGRDLQHFIFNLYFLDISIAGGIEKSNGSKTEKLTGLNKRCALLLFNLIQEGVNDANRTPTFIFEEDDPQFLKAINLQKIKENKRTPEFQQLSSIN